ncbi:MAG: NUDIX domain-containing protein [Acholeplasmataceae bacterium]|nr:NUDIX domain-containing protein [Acholeplasmataceae bacterium]
MKKVIDVVGAMIMGEGSQIFCAQRKNEGDLALKWEIPSGRVIDGETPEACIIRSVKSEFGKDITILSDFLVATYEHEMFTITFHVFICESNLDYHLLNEYAYAQWIHVDDLLELEWTDIDYPVIIKYLEL